MASTAAFKEFVTSSSRNNFCEDAILTRISSFSLRVKNDIAEKKSQIIKTISRYNLLSISARILQRNNDFPCAVVGKRLHDYFDSHLNIRGCCLRRKWSRRTKDQHRGYLMGEFATPTPDVEKRTDGKVPITHPDTIKYMQDLLTSLKRIASTMDEQMLVHLLDLATAECVLILKRPPRT